jgi:hypothetical protein
MLSGGGCIALSLSLKRLPMAQAFSKIQVSAVNNLKTEKMLNWPLSSYLVFKILEPLITF